MVPGGFLVDASVLFDFFFFPKHPKHNERKRIRRLSLVSFSAQAIIKIEKETRDAWDFFFIASLMFCKLRKRSHEETAASNQRMPQTHPLDSFPPTINLKKGGKRVGLGRHAVVGG